MRMKFIITVIISLGWIAFAVSSYRLYHERRTVEKTRLELLSLKQELARLRLLEKDLAEVEMRQNQLSLLLQDAGDSLQKNGNSRAPIRRERSEPIIPSLSEEHAPIDLHPDDPVPHLWPVAGWVTQIFRATATPNRPAHKALDLAGRLGSPVIAPAHAEVLTVHWDEMLGRVLEMQHAAGHITRYGHLQRVEVKPGDFVKTGETIARLGNSGISTAPHLHYEIELEGELLDPSAFIPGLASADSTATSMIDSSSP